MGRKGNLAVFESSNISETGEVTPTKIGVHVHAYFFESINRLNFLILDYMGHGRF